MRNKPCKHCGLAGHTAAFCWTRPRQSIANRKRINQIGKIGRKWIAFRAEWLMNHPPDAKGNYYCYIDGEALKPREVTLDHIKSRTRHPALRFVDSNIAPCCYRHNREKGSLSLDEYLAKIK